jgi:hypothetical protein
MSDSFHVSERKRLEALRLERGDNGEYCTDLIKLDVLKFKKQRAKNNTERKRAAEKVGAIAVRVSAFKDEKGSYEIIKRRGHIPDQPGEILHPEKMKPTEVNQGE